KPAFETVFLHARQFIKIRIKQTVFSRKRVPCTEVEPEIPCKTIPQGGCEGYVLGTEIIWRVIGRKTLDVIQPRFQVDAQSVFEFLRRGQHEIDKTGNDCINPDVLRFIL